MTPTARPTEPPEPAATDRGLGPTAQRGSGREWPTVAVAGAVAALLAGLLGWGHALPAVVRVALLAVTACWFGSLQHELVHGHLGGGRAAAAIAWIPVSLYLPFDAYRRLHLRHHHDEHLTDPLEDPESWYVSRRDWDDDRSWHRALLWANRTLLGRLAIGPGLSLVGFGRNEWRHLRAGTDGARRRWALHLPLAAAWSALVWQVADFPFWQYALGATWFGAALTLVRSFAEHRWTPEEAGRTAMVRANPVMALLFLNNNLHVAHHLKPGAPWYRLPRLADELGCDARAAAGGGWYRGYGEIVRRYLVRPFDQPVHPSEVGRQRAPRALGGARST